MKRTTLLAVALATIAVLFAVTTVYGASWYGAGMMGGPTMGEENGHSFRGPMMGTVSGSQEMHGDMHQEHHVEHSGFHEEDLDHGHGECHTTGDMVPRYGETEPAT